VGLVVTVKSTLIITCSCSHLDHSVRFTHWPGEDGLGVIDVVLDSQESFWRRLSAAWRYLFNRTCAYGACAEITITPGDAAEIRAWADGVIAASKAGQ